MMWYEWKRMMTGKGFWLAVLLGIIGIVGGTAFPQMDGLLEPGQFLILIGDALTSKLVCYLMPVTAVLPWSDSFLGEWKSGFLKAALPRLGRRQYVENKIMAVAGGSALAWITSGGLVLLAYFLVFFPLEKQGSITVQCIQETLQVLLRCALLAASVGSLGGIFAALTGSSYLAFGIPFVSYYFCIILQERYVPDALWLYPPQWISGSASWGTHKEGLWLFLLLMLAGAMCGHAAALYARIEVQ